MSYNSRPLNHGELHRVALPVVALIHLGHGIVGGFVTGSEVGSRGMVNFMGGQNKVVFRRHKHESKTIILLRVIPAAAYILTYNLTFCLTYILAFYLTSHLRYIHIFWHSIWLLISLTCIIYSDIPSDFWSQYILIFCLHSSHIYTYSI